MEALEATAPGCGARFAALALHSLAEVLERFRVQRLTRHQHVLFRAGRMIAVAEGAMVLAKRAARAAKGELPEKADRRFEPAALAAVSRANAREAALEVAQEGLRWAVGADGVSAADLPAFTAAVRLPEILGSQAGLMADLDLVADALYGRTPAARA
jgi:alkylation response protein AidB-like acyl-CoA dehydrogenase